MPRRTVTACAQGTFARVPGMTVNFGPDPRTRGGYRYGVRVPALTAADLGYRTIGRFYRPTPTGRVPLHAWIIR